VKLTKIMLTSENSELILKQQLNYKLIPSILKRWKRQERRILKLTFPT